MRAMSRAVVVAVVVAGLMTWSWAAARTHAKTHASQAKAGICEVCGKSLVARTEVVAQNAGATHHYRCIDCALLAARDRLKGDVTLRTHSALRGTPVTWTRTRGKWRVTPASTRVLDLPETKGDCAKIHLVFANEEEYGTYAKQHPDIAGQKLFAGAEANAIVEAGRPPLPKQATCPVSGEKVHPTAKTDWTMYNGKVYYFCCANCKPRFVSDPAGYLSGKHPKPNMAGTCGDHAGGGCGAEGGSCAGASGKTGKHAAPAHKRPAKAKSA